MDSTVDAYYKYKVQLQNYKYKNIKNNVSITYKNNMVQLQM